ncbi:unnamed protein product [Pelagomonas calceolata]|uniref:RING-type E3 ubiquitin transferase n=1 Tax=Pelagomonas calceolata TaxID=35677 RepID=A0A8J2SN54_9STRA|nr:unnamed protein product [Pelagomonas calceolata]
MEASLHVVQCARGVAELRRQNVTPAKLRGLKVALRRQNCATIDGDALQKALATQNLRMNDANAAAFIREAARRAANNEEGAPTDAPLIGVLTLLADLFAPGSQAPAAAPATVAPSVVVGAATEEAERAQAPSADSASPPPPAPVEDVRTEVERLINSLRSRQGAGKPATTKAVKALGQIAKTSANRALITDAGGIGALLSVVTNDGGIDLKRRAVGILGQLASGNKLACDAIKKAGCISPLLEFVTTAGNLGENDEDGGQKLRLAAAASKALVVIAGDDGATRATISEALVVLFSTTSPPTQTQALQALGAFVRKAANCDAIVETGAIPRLVEIVANGSEIGQRSAAKEAAKTLHALGERVLDGGCRSQLRDENATLKRKLEHYEPKVVDLTQDDDAGDDAAPPPVENELLTQHARATSERLVAVKQEAADERERADFQGTNAMYLTAQKSELQRLVSDAARALIEADVPTHECPDDKTPFYYMLESHRDDGKQTVPWNPEAGRAMTLAEGIAWLRNNPPSKKRRTRRPESDRLTDSLSSSSVPRRAAAGGRRA